MFGKQKIKTKVAHLHTGKIIFAVVLACAYVIGLSLFAGQVQTADAAIPKYINFQGKLTAVSNGSNVANGSYSFEFKLYDAVSGGSLLWTETWDGAPAQCPQLAVAQGVFNAKLGACEPLTSVDFTGGALYLTVNFNPGAGFDGEMAPRKQLVSSAYAFVANGVSGDGVVNNAVSSATALSVADVGSSDYAFQVDTSAATAVTGLKVTSAAAAGGLALTTISSGANENLTMDAKGSGTISLGGTSTGNVLFGGGYGLTGASITSAGNISTNGTLLTDTSVSTPSIITASGALGITPASGSNVNITLATTGDFAVNTSQLYVDTSTARVGIGTASPSGKLHIYSAGGLNSGINLEATSAAAYAVIDFNTDAGLAGQFLATGSSFSNGIFTGDQLALANYLTNGSTTLVAGGTNGFINFATGGYLTGNERMRIDPTGKVGIGDTTPAALLTVGSGDLFQVNSSGAIAAVVGITSAGAAVSLNNNSNFNVDIATGTSTGTITLGGTGTQAIDIGAGVAAKTITIGNANDDTFSINSSGLDVSTAGAITNATGFNGLVVTANTGVVTTGTWNGTAVGSQYGGTGQNWSATSGVPSLNSGIWSANAITQNGVIYGGASNALSFTAVGTTGQCLVGNTGSAPSWSSCAGLVTLQAAYDATSGNTITTTDARNIAITLANVTTPTSLTIENQDTAATSAQRIFNSIATGTATNGLLIEQTGAGTMTNAIQIAETAGTITDGILITGTLGNILNSGSIDITGAGAITGSTGFNGLVVTANTGVVTTGTWNGSLITGTYGGTGVNNGASTITLGGNLITSGAFATTLTSTATTNVTLPTSGTLYGTATGSITSNQLLTSLTDETGSGLAVFGTSPTFSASAIFTGLTASSAVYTDGSKSLTSTAPTSGTLGYWSRSGTTLSQATANDVLSLSGNSGDILTVASSATGSANKSINISQTGATAGTDYAGYFSNTGAATTNIGLYATATGGTNNYAAIFEDGNVGIGTTTPVATLSLQRSGSDASYRARTYSNTNWQGNYLVGDRAEGTSGSPLPVTAGDHIVGVTANAYANSAFNFAGSFTFYVEGAPSGSNVPTYFTLWTTSASGSGERIHVEGGGEIGFNTSAPDKQLEINSAAGNNLRLTYNDSDGSAANYADLLTTASGDLTVTPSGGDVDITGILNVNSLTTDTAGVTIASGQSYSGSGAVTLSSATASALTINSGTTGTINIGTDASAETINIGNTGAAAKIIAIGNNSQANTITIGDASATGVSITDNNWSVTTAGAASFTTMALTGAVTGAASYNGLVITANTGVVTTGTWNGTAITDTYVADTLTVDSSSSVHWNALNNYPAACSAGSAISQLADTTNTCTSFNTDTSITLQDAYGATSGNTITTTDARNLAITLANVTTPTSFTIENQDTAATSAQRIFNSIATGTATNGLLIEQTGAGTLTNGIQIAETAGTITDGILITGTLGNILNSGSIDITGTGAITGATGLVSSGTIQFSALTSNGPLYTSAGNGTLTSTAPTSGAIGYWSRTGTTLSQTTANDVLSLSGNTGDIVTVASSATGSANKAISISQTGATTGTDYAGYFSNTGAATTNVGLYATATGASSNYAAIFDAGNVGIGTTTPAYKLVVDGGSGNGYAGLDVSNPNPTLYMRGDATNGYYPNIDFAPQSNGSLGGVIQSYSSNGGLYISNRGVNGALIVSNDVSNRTNTILDELVISHNTSGTPAANYGTGILISGETTTSPGQDMSRIASYWTDATHATRTSNLGFSTALNGTLSERLTVQGSTGNLGIGDTTPTSLLTVGSGDLFQVNSSGAIAAATAITSAGNIRFTGLGGGGTQCVNVDNDGDLGVTTCGGALTPWTSDIDADGYDLNDLSNILFRETTGAPTSTDVGLFRDNAGDLNLNALSTKSINLQIAGADEYNFSSTTLNMNSNTITNAGTINGLQITANTGVVTTGTWNGTAVVDTYVADTLTIDSSSSVHWNALNNYPAACSAGSAISALADTTNTCTSFNTDTSITLQDAYGAGNSIETASNTSVVITETTTGAVTGDLLQLTVNQATGGTYSGDALQITMDGVDANAYTGNGINIIVDQSQNTGSPILVQDDAAVTLFQLSENGAITLGAASAETTAITITDTDYTNALSIGDNNIIGTTSAIDFTNFDVSSAGAIVGVGVNSGSGLLQGTGGLTLTGAISVTNNGSSTVDINTGTSTGLVTIGGGSGTFSLQTTNIDISNTGAITGSTGFNGLVVTANTGVVTTGTWNGSLITGTYGGTGVNNGASTITLGGNLITSGAFATTLTSTATTNVTLPTSGTLYGTATGSITSNQLLTSLTDETGSGLAVFGTSPTFSASAIFSGLTASSAVYTDGSKSLTSTAPTSGAIGYWSRTGTVLSQTTANDTISLSGNAGDIITVASSATGAANKSINISQTGATAGTDYAGYFSNTGAATTNVGLYSTASGGTNNYAAIFDAGNVGVGGTPNGANGILQVTGSLGMTGNTEIRQSTNADGNTLRVLATQLVAGNSNAVGYGYAGGGLVAGVSPSASTLLLDVGGSDAGTAHRLKVANDGSGVTGTLFYGTPSLTTLYGDSSTGLVGVGTNAPGSYDVGITKAVVLSTASSGLSIISGTASYGALYFGDGTDGTDAAYRGGVEYYHSTDSMKIWAGASSATPNLFLTSTGTVGIGTTGPDRRLDVLDASNPQIRLTTTDGTVYSDLQNTATANLIVTGDSLTSSSAKEYGLQISPTINQTSTASYTALDINVTETAATTANGLNRLADFKVGGSSKLAVANNGAVTLQNAASLTTAYGGFGKIENHLTKSEEFDHANWTKSSVTAPTANTQVSPDGSTTAESLATSGSGGYVQQDTSTAVSSTDYTFSVWARSASGTQSFSMRVDGTTTGTGTEITHTATTSWQRFSVTQAVGGFTGNVRVRIYPGTSASTGTIYAWGAQVEKSSVPNTYAKTTTAGLTNDTSRGLVVNNNMLNTTASGYVYGGRQINTIDSTTAGTHIGQFIRMLDNTSLDSGQNVRGLEVQAYSGTNVNGTNTGIAAYGYTFGLQATTTSQAAAQATPAAIFADLDNGTDATTKARGNAIRAYTDNATSADLVSFYQETSTYTGNGLLMNFGNGGGSFSGNFVNLQNAATSKYTISSAGRHDFLTADADNVIPIYINSEESTVTQTLFAIESDTVANGQTVDTVKAHFEADGSLFVSLTGTQNTTALCHANNGQSNNDEIVDCSGAPSDVAEYFGSEDPTLTAGEIVVVGKNATEMHLDGYHTSKAWIARSTGSYQDTLMGVISTAPAAVYGDEIFSASENPRPVALVGRVPVKVNLENGPIKAGDFITSSSTPGVGMKATKSGPVIGQALDKYDGNNEIGTIIVFIKPTNYNGVEIDDQLAGLQFDFTGTEEGLVNSAENSNAILEHLLSQLANLDPNNLSQVNTDIVIAGGEIISPTVTTQTLRADFLTSATAEGGLEVASTTMFNGGLLVDSISSIGDLLSFSSDVEFFGTPYFTADTAGFAVVQTGAQSVDVVFGREYLAQPIVSASISFEQDVDQSLLDQEARDVLKANSVSEAQLFLNDQISYVVTNKSKFGFTIVLNKPATRDIKLSWVALAVRNATTFMSLEGQEVTPNDSNSGDVAGDFTPDPVLDPVTPPDGSGDVVVPDPVTPPTDGGADPVL